MVYSSKVVGDLALLFKVISNVTDAYAFHGLKVDYDIYVIDRGFIAVFKPYGL